MVYVMAVFCITRSSASLETFQLKPGNRHLAATPHTAKRQPVQKLQPCC
jgi:hypothetical protein